MAQAAYQSLVHHIVNPTPLDNLKAKSLRIEHSLYVFFPHFHGIEKRNYLSIRLMVFNIENGCVAFRDDTGYYVTKVECFPEADQVLRNAGFERTWFEVMHAMGEYPAENPERSRWEEIVSMARGIISAI